MPEAASAGPGPPFAPEGQETVGARSGTSASGPGAAIHRPEKENDPLPEPHSVAGSADAGAGFTSWRNQGSDKFMGQALVHSLEKRHAIGERLRVQIAEGDRQTSATALKQYNRVSDDFRQRIVKKVADYAAFTESACAVMIVNQDGQRVHDISLEKEDGVVDFTDFEDAVLVVHDVLEQNYRPPSQTMPSTAQAAMDLGQVLSTKRSCDGNGISSTRKKPLLVCSGSL